MGIVIGIMWSSRVESIDLGPVVDPEEGPVCPRWRTVRAHQGDAPSQRAIPTCCGLIPRAELLPRRGSSFRPRVRPPFLFSPHSSWRRCRTAAAALAHVPAGAAGGGRRLDSGLARIARRVGLAGSSGQALRTSVFAVVIYAPASRGSVAGYAWAAMTELRGDARRGRPMGVAAKSASDLAYLVRRGIRDITPRLARFVFDRPRCRARMVGEIRIVGGPPACGRRAHRHPRLLLDRHCRPADVIP